MLTDTQRVGLQALQQAIREVHGEHWNEDAHRLWQRAEHRLAEDATERAQQEAKRQEREHARMAKRAAAGREWATG